MAVPNYEVGDAVYYYGTGSSLNPKTPHTHVIVKIDSDKGDVYLIPISTFNSKCDQTCIVDETMGVPKIVHKSYASYFHARKVGIKGFEMKLEASEITYSGKIPDDVFQRIVAGIKVSEDVEDWFLREF